MPTRTPRSGRNCVTAAFIACILLGLTGCSDDSSPAPTKSPTPTALTGCTGGEGPSFAGKATSFDAPVATADQLAVATDVSAPAVSSTPAEQSRYRIASVHVSARVVQNGSFVVSPVSLVLLDPEGRLCSRPAQNPLAQPLGLTTIDEQRGADGNVAFLVPADADLADYSVVYVAQPTDRTALAQWSRKGIAPRRTVTDACDGPQGTYDRSNSATSTFGSTGSTVRDGVGTEITAGQPRPRPLAPSSTVPGNVQGITVDIAVTAREADSYVDRRQFVLLDSDGRSCRFGSIPSPGETLTNVLVKAGSTTRYTLIFWAPKGATLKSFTLLQLTDPASKKVATAWSTAAK